MVKVNIEIPDIDPSCKDVVELVENEITIQVETSTSTRIDKVDKKEYCLDLRYCFNSSGAPFYSGEIQMRGLFVFAESRKKSEYEDYLLSDGTMQLYNSLKQYLETVTANGVFGKFSIPTFKDVLNRQAPSGSS